MMIEGNLVRKISVQNFKGGVGKTATVLNLGACLADRGYKVLMIDCDTQGDLTEVSGIRLEKRQPTLYHVLIEDLNVMEVIVQVRDRLFILPSDKKLAAAEALLVAMTARETTLSQRLSYLTEFDFVLLDCAPAMNLMHQNALLYASELIIPVDMDKLAISGCRAILESVKTLGEYNNFRIPELTGIIPTFVDQRTNITSQVMGVLETLYPGKILPSIRSDTKLKQAAATSRSIFDFDPKSKSAHDYRCVADAIIQLTEKRTYEQAAAINAG
jgi:chromosome partitioning protein